MPIISFRDKKNSRWKRNANNNNNNNRNNKQRQKRARGSRNYSERVRAKWFCCAFKLGFLHLICNASLIFKSNLELALSIILKQRGLYESKQVGGVQMFKNMRLVILFDMILNFSLKMRTSFTNVARTTASTSKFIY